MEQDCQHLAQQNARLAARLAEVEAERDRAQSLARLNSLMGGEGPVMVPVEAARCPDCGSERYRHHRSDVVAERDRLAQELEDTLDRAREAIAYLRIVLEGGHSGAAREFLARFPEKEDGKA